MGPLTVAPGRPASSRRRNDVGIADTLHQRPKDAAQADFDVGRLAAQGERGRDRFERRHVIASRLDAQASINGRFRGLEREAA